jgi:hypothetical protein
MTVLHRAGYFPERKVFMRDAISEVSVITRMVTKDRQTWSKHSPYLYRSAVRMRPILLKFMFSLTDFVRRWGASPPYIAVTLSIAWSLVRILPGAWMDVCVQFFNITTPYLSYTHTSVWTNMFFKVIFRGFVLAAQLPVRAVHAIYATNASFTLDTTNHFTGA